MEVLEATDKECQIMGLFMGMFVDQKIGKERMLRLCTPDNLGRVYDVVNAKSTVQCSETNG